jgi:predicted amidohydrolase YtcJ
MMMSFLAELALMWADLVLINGNVITMNSAHPRAQAVAVKNGLIVAVGTQSEIKQWIGKDTKTVNLRGKTVVPGLIDTHVHMAGFGFSLTQIDLRGVSSIEEVKRLLQKRVQETPKGKWVLGRGWDQDRFEEKRYPTCCDLNEVSPHNPVAFTRVCGHIGVANSRALEIAGITKKTTAPPSGQIDKDSKTGEPTGILRESAYDLVLSKIPEPSEEELAKACSLACEKAVEAGLTSVHWLVGSSAEIRILQKLREIGRLPLRVYLIVPMELLDGFAHVGLRTGFGDCMLRLGGVKVFADGSLGARTAALTEAYDDEHSTRGILCLSQRDLDKMVMKAQKAGFQTCVHAIGDRAVDAVLTAFERVLEGSDGNVRRNRMEHASVLNKQLIKRLKKLGLIVCVQPHFVVSDFWVEARLGRARARWTHPFKTLIDNGVLITGGSDCPVELINPLLGVYALVTREPFPEERVSVEEALKVYTINAAYASFEEKVKGSIELGKLADFTVLSHNPFTVKPEKIKDVKVEMTVVGGDIVYSRRS